MKRRLPSKITQESGSSSSAANVTVDKDVQQQSAPATQADKQTKPGDTAAVSQQPPSTKDDETAIAMAELDAMLSKKQPQPAPEKTESKTKTAEAEKPAPEKNTAATPKKTDEIAQNKAENKSENKANTTPPAADKGTQPSKPSKSTHMKRRVGGNKGMQDVLKSSAKGGPMGQPDKPKEEKKLAIAEDEDTGKRSVRADADEATSTAVEEIQGNIVHPADMETEAAYMSLEDDAAPRRPRAEAEEMDYKAMLATGDNAPKTDVSPQDKKPTPANDKTATNQEQPAPTNTPNTAPTSTFTAPLSYGETADTPSDSSSDTGWDLADDNDDTPPSSSPTASGDLYSTLITEDPLAEAQGKAPAAADETTQKSAGGQFPWLQTSGSAGATGDKALKAPELPSFVASAAKKGFSPVPFIILLVVGAGIFFGVKLLMGDDKTQERMARASQSLTEVTEKIPSSMGGAQDIDNPNLIQPEEVITPDEYAQQDMQQQLEEWANAEPVPPLDDSKNSESATQIDFVDVDATEADELIVADDEKLPDDISALAKLQRAIAKEREKRDAALKGGAGSTEGDKTSKAKSGSLTPEEKLLELSRSEQLKKQLQADLAAYKAALANIDEPALRPKPKEFFEDPEKYLALAGNPAIDSFTNKIASNGDLLPPTTRGAQDLPASVLYNENPYNLPVIPEPEINPELPVRTLDDFPEAMFENNKPRVKIPQGVRPSLRTSAFPQVSLLSLVPDRGIVALHKGREGVLLVGENIEGWELVGVYKDYAEFRSAGRKHLLTIPQ